MAWRSGHQIPARQTAEQATASRFFTPMIFVIRL